MKYSINSFYDLISNTDKLLCIKKYNFEKQIIKFIKYKFKKELNNNTAYYYNNKKKNSMTFLFTNGVDVFLIHCKNDKVILKKYSCNNIKCLTNDTIMLIFINNLNEANSNLYCFNLPILNYSKILLKNNKYIWIKFIQENLSLEYLLFNLYTDSYIKQHDPFYEFIEINPADEFLKTNCDFINKYEIYNSDKNKIEPFNNNNNNTNPFSSYNINKIILLNNDTNKTQLSIEPPETNPFDEFT